jgi:hypothetical protein
MNRNDQFRTELCVLNRGVHLEKVSAKAGSTVLNKLGLSEMGVYEQCTVCVQLLFPPHFPMLDFHS